MRSPALTARSPPGLALLPRPNPTVDYLLELFLLSFSATAVTFFIIGVFLSVLRTHRKLEGVLRIPSGDRPSNPIRLRQVSMR